MRSRPFTALLFVCLAWTATGPVRSQTPSLTGAEPAAILDGESASVPSPFQVGSCAPGKELFFQALVGSYATSPRIPPHSPEQFDYIPAVFRIGCRPWEGRGLLGDRTSILFEGLIAPIYRDYGHFMGGPSILVRVDLCDADRAVVPYVQLGTGFVLTDAYKDQTQRGIGECFEFLQQATLGARWNLRPDVAVFAEGGFQHISNAHLAPRNQGVNSFGISIGIQWSYMGR